MSVLTGMGWGEVVDLPWPVLETYLDVLNKEGKGAAR